MNQTEQQSDYKKLWEPESQRMATHGKQEKKPEYTTEEFQDSSRDLYNTRSFIKKAFDFSFVQTALYMTEAAH